MRDDNYMNPNDKARWGFSGTAKDVKVGTETVGETGGVDHVRVEPELSLIHISEPTRRS